jgi:hypothetical protein
MATGFPVKANYATGDILTATNMNDLAGTVNYLSPVGQTNGTTLVADSSTSTGLRYQVPVNVNPVLNSAFQVWQRGTANVTTASAYTADRWQKGGGTHFGVSRQTTNDTTNLPNIQYCARVQRTAGSTVTTGMDFAQSFETINSIPYAGKTVTLSFYARAGANYSASGNALNAYIYTGTGTDQNITVFYTGSTASLSLGTTLTTTWQRFTGTATLPATLTEMGVYILGTPTGTAGANDYYEITGVQIEVGSVATPFKTYAGTLQGELAACQRYFETSYDAGTALGTATETGMVGNYWNVSSNQTGYMGQNVLYKVSKRITAPTITIYDAAGTSGKMAVHQASGANVNNVAYTGTVQNGMSGFTLYTSGYGSGMTGFNFHFTSSAEL